MPERKPVMNNEQISPVTECPVIPLAGKIAYPDMTINLLLSRKSDIRAFEEVYKNSGKILLVPQKDPTEENPDNTGFYKVGTVCKINQFARKSENRIRVLFTGLAKADVNAFYPDESGSFWKANFTERKNAKYSKADKKACISEAYETVMRFLGSFNEKNMVSAGFREQLAACEDFSQAAELISSNLFDTFNDKIDIYLESNPRQQLLKTLKIINTYTEALAIRKKIHEKVRFRSESNQRDYILNEQLRAIQEELGEDSEGEADKYVKTIESSPMPADIKEKLTKEAVKLRKMPVNSAEYNVVCNYLDACLELPWGKADKENLDLKNAQAVLDKSHDGLEKVKERIIEYLAVRKLTDRVNNQIICLVGPPGTGKTTIARTIAEATGRKYVRVSLGGIRDEADIRGHRKTYIASMPGRIIEGIKRAGSTNPLMLLDEIDKMTKDAHGDPAAALMEVLDADQNREFRDHFLEFPFDLSEVMFVATANTLDTIPAPLLDRMEVIKLRSYSVNEKLSIAKNHLIPKQMKRHGIESGKLRISTAALNKIIAEYTMEAGVRNLEREIANVCRKAAKQLVMSTESSDCIKITPKNIPDYLGAAKISPETVSESDEVGVVNGLAYTEAGGTLLKVEVASMPGTGKIELTGSLGDVMKESAKAAVTYIRSHSDELKIDGEFYKNKDLHIHFPEGAVPKDGPSAGVTMVSAIISELSGRPVKSSVAMTGEVTLKGKVLGIGGLKEKTMAAYNAGVKTVLLPRENLKDLDEIDSKVRESLRFIPCSTVSDVIKNAMA